MAAPGVLNLQLHHREAAMPPIFLTYPFRGVRRVCSALALTA